MSGEPIDPELREALEELRQYLSDTLPPLVVADAFQVLLRHPPDLMAKNIHNWTASQYRGGTEIPVSDYLFHAVKKVALMGEFHLLPPGPFATFLEELKERVLVYCPEGDREFLRSNLERLKDATTSAAAAPVAALFRQMPASTGSRHLASASGGPGGSGGSKAGDAVPGEDLQNLRRLSVLLDRLDRGVGSGGGAGGQNMAPLTSQALTAAARTSRSGKEFEQSLERLREMGLDVNMGDVFRSLGSSLPGWIVPGAAEEARAAEVPASPALEAMRRMVTGSQDPAEGSRRFQEMVRSAIERFNEGSLAQAATMIELADRIIAERAVEPVAAQTVRKKAHELLDQEHLKKYAESSELHPQLRKV
ncbi:MAG: hypothetical protein M3R34_03105, partial [Acidobacteriota bacterium]|nr:hypothetical protein [Acidobacteriota bacterium]